MYIRMENAVLVKVFVSTNRPGRVYVDVIDIDGAAGQFNFSAEMTSQDISALNGNLGKQGVLEGDFQVYGTSYMASGSDGDKIRSSMNFKSVGALKFAPLKK